MNSGIVQVKCSSAVFSMMMGMQTKPWLSFPNTFYWIEKCFEQEFSMSLVYSPIYCRLNQITLFWPHSVCIYWRYTHCIRRTLVLITDDKSVKCDYNPTNRTVSRSIQWSLEKHQVNGIKKIQMSSYFIRICKYNVCAFYQKTLYNTLLE